MRKATIKNSDNQTAPSRDHSAAIVCGHVATKQLPILRAVRDAPIVPEDSGWQFLCGSGEDEDPGAAKIWLVCEVLDHEPSLAPFIDYPPGTELTRRNRTSGWEVCVKS